MAIIAQMDMNIGDTAPAAYVRIVNFTYRPEVKEIELMINGYYSKGARKLDTIKNYLEEWLKTATISSENLRWLQNKVMCRISSPLLRTSISTRQLNRFTGLIALNTGDTIPLFNNTTGDTVPPKYEIATTPALLDSNGDTITLSYFYNWMKATKGFLGPMNNVQDDFDSSIDIINEFKLEHPEIFNGE